MASKHYYNSLTLLLAVALVVPLPAVANDKYFFSEAHYSLTLDEPTRANQVALQPLALTLGDEFLDDFGVEDLMVRCSLFAGRKGVKVRFSGTIAEGEGIETAGSFPEKSAKTKKNGYAVAEFDSGDLMPQPGGDFFDDPLLAAMVATLDGKKEVEGANLSCTLGVPSVCHADETRACLRDDRFALEMLWEDPFDFSMREATVGESDNESVRFFFPGLDTLEGRIVSLLDFCGAEGGELSKFWAFAGSETDVVLILTILDTWTGVSRQYDQNAILDTEAFETCP